MRNKTMKLAAVIATVRVLAEWDVSMRRSVHRQSYAAVRVASCAKPLGLTLLNLDATALSG